MKKLLKSEICGSHVLFTGPTDVLKWVEKSNNAATIHEQLPHYLLKHVPQKKNQKKRNALNVVSKPTHSLHSIELALDAIYYLFNF